MSEKDELEDLLATLRAAQQGDLTVRAKPGGGSLGEIVDKSGVPVTKSGIPPMPFLTFDHVDGQYKERRTEFYTQCIRRGLFVQPYHHWYICYRHTEADLTRALDVVEEALAYVAESHPWQR